jgi:hypothetical protein
MHSWSFFQECENSQHKISTYSTIEMYCVENKVCVVLGMHTHGFQDPKWPET